MERQENASWKKHIESCDGTKNEFSSKIFHRHQGVGLAYSILSAQDEIAGKGGGPWASVEMKESWLATLGSWSDALAMYERKLEEFPGNPEAILGCMKCLISRGEWKRVLEKAENTRNWDGDASTRDRRKAVKFCAEAAWRLGQWDDLELYSSQLLEGKYRRHHQHNQRNISASRVDYDGAFYTSILKIHRHEWSAASYYIDAARRAMDSRFTALMAESHTRAYKSMVEAQTLAEMEEIITFRKLEGRAAASTHRHPTNRDDDVLARRRLLSLWKKRWTGCRVDSEVHSQILAVRSLVLSPTDDVQATLTLSTLSREAQCYKLAEKVLLDPLDALHANLEGPIFGINLPQSLALGLSCTRDAMTGGYPHSGGVDRLLRGEGINFFPYYHSSHNQYCDDLIAEAGGLDRYVVCLQVLF